MNKVSRYFKGVSEEVRRVRWPDRKTLWKYVFIVLVTTIIVALFLYLFDFLAIQINRAFESAFPKPETTEDESTTEAAAMIANYIGGFIK